MLIELLFFGSPIIAFILFGVSLYRYLSATKQNKTAPATFSYEEIQQRKKMLIVTAVITAVFAMIIAGFVALTFLAIAYM